MPFKCIEVATGKPFISVQIPTEDWKALRDLPSKKRGLVTACCGVPASPKTSGRGTQFFAHQKRGECTTAPETAEHLLLKQIAFEAALSEGWEADVEVSGRTEDGRDWRADVLASRKTTKVAIEVQWSRQTNEELRERQERYEAAGIRCLWLNRHPGAPISEKIPSANLVAVDDEFYACLPKYDYVEQGQRKDPHHYGWHQSMPVRDFLAAAFSGRLKWGFKEGMEATAFLQTHRTRCWKCKRRMTVLWKVGVSTGSLSAELDYDAFGEHPDLMYAVFPKQELAAAGIGTLKNRFSKTARGAYFSNGCIHCDALYGRWNAVFSGDEYRSPDWSA